MLRWITHSAILALFLLVFSMPVALAQHSSIIGGGVFGDTKVSGGGCAQATTLNAKLDGSQNTSAVTTAVCGMVTDGTWALLDWLYVFAINSSGNAVLNWVSTSYTLTNNGACTFTANGGYNNSGSCFLSNTYVPSTAGGNATLNSTTIGVCEETSTTANAFFYAAGGDGTNITWLGPFYAGAAGPDYADINDTNFTTLASTPTNGQGSWILSRTGASTMTLYQNGTSFATPNGASSALVAKTIYILARNNNGTADSFTPGGLRFGYAFYGAGMNATQVANIRSRLNTYMTTVGASGC